MIGPREATTTEGRGVHVKILSILLHQNIRSDFRRSEQTVHAAVDGHFLGDAVVVLVRRVDFPTKLLLDKRQAVRRITVDLVGRSENERRIFSELASVLQ